jgi:hypothetical protein
MEWQDGERLRQAAGIRTVQVGDARVSYVPDGVVKMVPTSLFPSTSQDTWEENSQYLDESGWLTISAGGLLIERGDRAMLVDRVRTVSGAGLGDGVRHSDHVRRLLPQEPP